MKVYGWSTMTSVTDVRGDLKPESTGWLFKSPLAGGGGIFSGAPQPTTGRTACSMLPTVIYGAYNNIYATDVNHCGSQDRQLLIRALAEY